VDVALLRDTLELTLARDDSFPARFYELLFERHPEVVPLFHRNSPGAQRKVFAQKLVAIVDHVDDPAWITREFGELVRTHREYGVTPEMYPWVGEALIETLREACGDAWSPEAEREWTAAYAQLTAAVLAAYERHDEGSAGSG
jgi:hemoglobin-like flavoprotein